MASFLPARPQGGGGGVNFDGAPSNILVVNNNSSFTPVSSNPSLFVTATLATELAAPVAGYDNDFISPGPGLATVSHNDSNEHDYRLDFSGTIVADDPSFLDTYVGVKISSDSGQEFTGGVKFYPVGVSFGGSSPAIGFSICVYGKVGANEKLSVQLSSNTAGNLILSDLIVFAVKIKPAG